MQTGLCTIAFRDRPFEAVLDLAVAAGFDGVEPWGRPNHMPDGYDPDYTRRAAEAVRQRGLVVAQYGSYANPTSEAFEAEMDAALQIARDFETDKIRVWAGHSGSADADAAQWETAVSGFRTFADRATDQGITLVIEMHNGRLSDTSSGCLRILEGVDRPNLRLNFQPMFTHTPEQVVQEAEVVAPYVTTVHAQNYLARGSNRRNLVEKGFVDFPRVIAILGKAGFDGFLEVEFVKEEDPEAALKADGAFLRRLCEGE